MTEPVQRYDAPELRRISETTIEHYDRMARPYWNGTRDHDVSQNYTALLEAIELFTPAECTNFFTRMIGKRSSFPQ